MALTFGLFVFAVRFHHTSNSMSMCVLFCFFFFLLLFSHSIYVTLYLTYFEKISEKYIIHGMSVRFGLFFCFCFSLLFGVLDYIHVAHVLSV